MTPTTTTSATAATATTSTPMDPPATGLTFPAPLFRKIAPTQYLLRHLQSSPPTRPSSRRPDEFRPATLHTRALSHAHGSAVVRMGDTAVVAGVRGEVLSLLHGEGKQRAAVRVRFEDHEMRGQEEEEDGLVAEMGLVVPNLELGTGCTHNYHPGPPSDFAQATAERLRSLLLDTLRLVPASTLRITHQDPTTTDTTTDTTSPPETKAFWTLYIDIVCISLDGNILDAALAACVAALKTTVLPVAHWDVDNERVVCSRTETRPLALASADGGLAFSASFGVVGWRGPGGGGGEEEEEEDGGDDGGNEVVRKWVLSDLDEFEEEVVPEKILVCIKNGGCIAKIEKSGGVLAGPEEVLECVRRAKERYRELERLVDSAVRAEAA